MSIGPINRCDNYRKESHENLTAASQGIKIEDFLEAFERRFTMEPIGKVQQVLREFAGRAKSLQSAFAVAGESACHGKVAQGPLGFRVGFCSARKEVRSEAVVSFFESIAARFNRANVN